METTQVLMRMERWTTTTAIGDAAHAVAPSSGQGVALAAEDVVTLATCLCGLLLPGIMKR